MAVRRSNARSNVRASQQVLSALEKQTEIVSNKSKTDSGKEKWKLPLDENSKELAVKWVSAKTVLDVISSRVETAKDHFCSYALEKITEKIYSQGCHPGNPEVLVPGEDGKTDHKFIMVMQDKFKIEVPKEFPEGVNQTEYLKDHYKSLLVETGLSSANANDLVEEEMEIFPVTGIRSISELLDGHYGEKRVWVDSTEEEKAAGQRLAALLVWDGSDPIPEPLTSEDKTLIVRRDTAVTMRSGFYTRVSSYCSSSEQLAGVFSLIKPILFPSYSKFAIEDSETDRVKRKISAAADILGN